MVHFNWFSHVIALGAWDMTIYHSFLYLSFRTKTIWAKVLAAAVTLLAGSFGILDQKGLVEHTKRYRLYHQASDWNTGGKHFRQGCLSIHFANVLSRPQPAPVDIASAKSRMQGLKWYKRFIFDCWDPFNFNLTWNKLAWFNWVLGAE